MTERVQDAPAGALATFRYHRGVDRRGHSAPRDQTGLIPVFATSVDKVATLCLGCVELRSQSVEDGSARDRESHRPQARTVDQACTNHGLAWSTAHIAVNGNFANTAEVGFSIHLDSSGNEFLVWFTEMDLQGHAGSANDNQTWPCSGNQTPSWGTRVGYRVEHVSGADTWDMHINCTDGSGWHRVGPIYDGFGLNTGIPMGEAGRREHTTNATGVDDDHNNLGYLFSSTWSNDRNGLRCRDDPSGDNNWQGVKDSGTAYHTVQGSGSC